MPYGALLVFIIYTLLALTVGNRYRISHVDVQGARFTGQSTIVNGTNVVGVNPFLINTVAVASRVKKLGVVQDVTVRVRLPNTVQIFVVELQPAYIWKVDPTLYLVASNGTVLGPTPKESERVIVVDADHRPVTVGEKLDVSIFKEASQLLTEIPLHSSLKPHYVLYSRAFGIIVPNPDGFTIAMGDGSGLAVKLQDLQPTLKAALVAKPRPSLVDLRFARHPYFR